MSLTTDEIKNIAYLARLSIEEDRMHTYADNLSGILDLVEQMNNVDTSAIAPMAHPQDMSQRLRADTITEENQREHFMENAPATEAGLFLVPKVIE
ncbi:MAG: Aspartyl-tRNA(Asn) amidotransferase subunit C (EC @ Glutamyl-tRNA(Gln) amidotransferase subunit C (EC [uncultured Thiotrichaceae bacterium]|uniref:Aspartyl/glutamyl-tRNA(Asn/Gln) amidotransferase subunit C n=1 Tax=uncultured Thiotrichaceae bacterium TaxID=298394 RepID=A0A6S6SXC3_9GAMM|nr:MAG: Aspartyl-tRNA(Asn) amidotransferase subunit C (EC @ Glutamyl-tRNA(Gln) amidotransferase subunit C (EC [uncultured Thiotrichaceae bacterium]